MKRFALHPDRNLNSDDPQGVAGRFAEFTALCNETVATEEKRSAYSQITTVDELEQLTNRVRHLAFDAANPGAHE